MTVVNQKETRTDLGELAEAGIHLPELTHSVSQASRRNKTTNMNMALNWSRYSVSSLSRSPPQRFGFIYGSPSTG